MIKTFNSLFVTMLGLGKIKFIPGTFGSLATTIILYILFHVLNISSNFILIGLVIIFIYSFPAVTSYIKDNENKDPGEIIIELLLLFLLIDRVHGVNSCSAMLLFLRESCFVKSCLYIFYYTTSSINI